MKKFAAMILSLTLMASLAACENSSDNGASENETAESSYVYRPLDNYARFMTNSSGEKVNVSTSFDATADSVLFARLKVTAGEKITPPSGEPARAGYKFAGWSATPDGEPFDFDTPLSGGITLYARWERDDAQNKDEYVEPKLSFVEQKDESAPLKLKSVLSSPIDGGNVRLTTAGLRLLNENKDNVKELLSYTVDSKTSIKSAVFSSNKITVTYDDGNGEKTEEVRVSDMSASLTVDSNYETKAAKYEETVDIPPYSVIMGGSSSMENWKTSVEDMKPVTTANVGIGGTVVEQWTEKLCERLVYPFNPRAVIFYVGINNIINAGKTGEQTGNALKALFDAVHSRLPKAHIYFIMINYVPGFTSYYDEIEIANDMVTKYSADKNYMTLIDAGAGLIKESGKTNGAYFLTDGLHMSMSGYVIWGNAVKNAFIQKETELYK